MVWLQKKGSLNIDISKNVRKLECMVLYIFYEEDNDIDYASVGFIIDLNNILVRWIICL